MKSEVTSKEELITEPCQQDSNDIQALLLNNDKVSDEDSSLPNNAIKHQTESPQGYLFEDNNYSNYIVPKILSKLF